MTGPVFIVEDGRSGATFLVRRLNEHPALAIGWESNFVVRLLRTYGARRLEPGRHEGPLVAFLLDEPKFHDWGISEDELRRLVGDALPGTAADVADAILRHAAVRDHPGARVYGIKKGAYGFHARLLGRHFTAARFIHLVRDGRAVYNSKKRALHSRTGEPFASTPRGAARHWLRLVCSYDAFAAAEPRRCLEVRYEDLIRDTDAVMGEITSFLDVPPLPAAAGATPSEGDYVPDRYAHLHGNVDKPPLTSRISAWEDELEAGEIRRYEQVAGAALARRGYALRHPLTRVLSLGPELLVRAGVALAGLRRGRGG